MAKKKKIVIPPECSITSLVAATIQQAKRDAKAGSEEARAWLLEEGALWLDVVMDIHPDHTRRWIERECRPNARVVNRLPMLEVQW